MRVKFFLLNVLILFVVTIKAQNSCPVGYQLRNVRCLNSPSMTQECIPANYTCNSCWQVEWQYCNGSNNKGYENASTYEDALKIANESIKNMESCKGSMGLDYNNYRIFIAGGDYCTKSNSNSQSTSSGNGNSNGNSINQSSNKSSNNNQTSTSNNQYQGGSRDLQLQSEIQFFYVQHHNAEEKLEEIKKKYPDNAMLYENNYRAKLQQLLNSVKSEDSKNNPSLETVKAFRSQLDQLIEQMATAETMALNNSNTQKTQQQQYQNQANDYLNKAQDTNQNAISRQMNLDLSKTNAIMAGNSNSKISSTYAQDYLKTLDAQRKLKDSYNEALISSIGNLILGEMNKRADERIAKMQTDMSAKFKTLDLIQDKQKVIFDSIESYYYNANNAKCFELGQACRDYTYLNLLYQYNHWEPDHWVFQKDIKEAEGITNGYFLFKYPKEYQRKYTFTSVAVEKFILPDIFQLPVCRLSNKDIGRTAVYEQSFANLLDCKKCEQLDLLDGIYSISCPKKTKVDYNEDSAITKFETAIYSGIIDKPVDALDYASATVWYNCLNSKKLSTINDLLNGIKSCIKYYKMSKSWSGFFAKNDYTVNNYLKISEYTINYYFLGYYMLLLNELASDKDFVLWVKERYNSLFKINFNRDTVIDEISSIKMYPEKWFPESASNIK